MRVLLVSDVQRVGGAGIAAHRLALALRDAGHEVHWAAARLDGTEDFPSYGLYESTRLQRVARAASRRVHEGSNQWLRQRHLTHRVMQVAQHVRPEGINMHNLHGDAFGPELPAQLSRRWPVVWTMHDMWPFTGGCTYSFDCRAFETTCTAACPHHETYPALPAAGVPRMFALRRQALINAGQLAFVSPSRWLADEAQRGILRGQRVELIPHSLDLTMFRPMAREVARQALGLSDSGPVVFASYAAHDSRKGGALLLEAMARLDVGPVTWLTTDKALVESLPKRVKCVSLGRVNDERLLALAYNAADVHVLPTLADNLPNTLVEACACGTPSVAADVGGVSEVVVEGTSGRLCAASDTEALARAIEAQLRMNTDEAESVRLRCRALAETRFSPARQAAAYEKLFRSLAESGMKAA